MINNPTESPSNETSRVARAIWAVMQTQTSNNAKNFITKLSKEETAKALESGADIAEFAVGVSDCATQLNHFLLCDDFSFDFFCDFFFFIAFILFLGVSNFVISFFTKTFILFSALVFCSFIFFSLASMFASVMTAKSARLLNDC